MIETSATQRIRKSEESASCEDVARCGDDLVGQEWFAWLDTQNIPFSHPHQGKRHRQIIDNKEIYP